VGEKAIMKAPAETTVAARVAVHFFHGEEFLIA
jgi:hypothetical protein